MVFRYVQQFLSDYHSYLLWVKKDRDRWAKMERLIDIHMAVSHCVMVSFKVI